MHKSTESMRRVLLLVACLSVTGALMAQPITKSTYNSMLQVAEEKLEAKDYYNALDYYERAYEERENRDLLPMIAELSLKVRDYAKARRTYANVFRRADEGEYEELRYNYGLACKGYERYDEAIEQFQLFIESSNDETMKNLARNQITGSEMAKAFDNQRDDDLPEPDRISRNVNQAFSEYAPAYSRSGNLYFSTFPSEEVIVVETEGCEGCYSMIYKSNVDEDGDFEDPAELPPTINRPGYHTSGVAFDREGTTMYYTQAELQGNTVKSSRIYASLGGEDDWDAGNELIGVNGEWVAMHPAPGELFGSKVLFFVSDMDGGEGGLDIYYATYKSEGVYGDPVNLGPKINTAGDEMTPFYFDGTLYYSSDGHPGIGGQDIFYTVWNGSFWSEPKNMGAGFNSAQDDQYFRLDNEGYKGFFTSNRPGGTSVYARTCCDDIYGFEIEKIEADLIVGVFDDQKKVIKGSTVDLKVRAATMTRTIDQQTNDEGNRFDFMLDLEETYQVIASKEGYYPDTALIATVGLKESRTFEQRFYLTPLPPPEPTEPTEPEGPLYDTVTLEQAIVLENILYDFADDKILPAAESDLQVILELLYEYPDMVIEMGSHTDVRGEYDYNQNLAQRRAESARTWLLERDIDPNRIQARGYGEEVPQTVSQRIADQYDFLTVGDVLTEEFINNLETEEQREAAHQINRRTEFKIIEGPTSITIQRTRLLKKDGEEEGEAANQPKPDPRIHPLSSLYGRTTPELNGLPLMVFEDRTHDFGNMERGDVRSQTFQFTNEGDGPLTISVVSACDCTTTDYPTKSIAPGESGEIKVTFDSTDKEENEIIDVDIILEQSDPDGTPIIEKLRYKYNLVQ